MSQKDVPSRVGDLAEGIRARRWLEGGPLGWIGRLFVAMSSQQLVVAVIVGIAFAIVCTFIANWSRQRPLVAVGRVMTHTQIVRSQIMSIDLAATEQARETAKAQTPRVYVADTNRIDEVRGSLDNLPITVAGVPELSSLDESVREKFQLTHDQLIALQSEMNGADTTDTWKAKVEAVITQLESRPLLNFDTWQKSTQEGRHSRVRLAIGDHRTFPVPRGELVNVDDAARLLEFATIIARDAGFMPPVRDAVVSFLTTNAKPTFRFDDAATLLDQNTAAERVGQVFRTNPAGQVIFKAGDVLTQAQLDLYRAEILEHESRLDFKKRALRAVGLSVLVGGIALAIAAYAALFVPRLRRDGARMLGMAAMLACLLFLAVILTVANPALAPISVVAPTVFAAIVVAIGYEQRVGLAFGVLHGLLVCIALDQDAGAFACIIAGVATAIWQLREVRDRTSVIRMSVTISLVVGIVTVLVGLIERPISTFGLMQLCTDAGWVCLAMLVLGGVTLFILPLIERGFDVVTSMTLIELRDPKQPLLRELQIRAPGTYNHSLNVASIAEAAAEAIKADSLLTYVGALYHDCGKMNKPEYFVENQLGGPNRHEKLNPAMSLLLIVGHVKDGVELAREFGIPRQLRHFIESHHGTTLVEYFFHRAKQQAKDDSIRQHEKHPQEPDDTHIPEEFEYRYPGPKPITREAAILMISDAVESATRTLAEPTPSRIEALVRTIANKRLLDGQFDDCDLTLKDLNLIVESVSRTVTSIYHGRVVYPGGSPARRIERTA